MDEPRRGDPGRFGASRGWLLAALGLVAGLLVAWWATAPPIAGAAPDAAAPAPPSAAVPAAASRPPIVAAAVPALVRAPALAASRVPRVRPPGADQSPDITDFINDGETPRMTDVIARLHAAGVHSGLGAFNPPGTKPVLVGLAVPEDFALPAGYVRHHQTTDDGQDVEPILMFAPDYQPLDASGRPVPLPADRVVPPELAPAGLPIRRITLPAPVTPR